MDQKTLNLILELGFRISETKSKSEIEFIKDELIGLVADCILKIEDINRKRPFLQIVRGSESGNFN